MHARVRFGANRSGRATGVLRRGIDHGLDAPEAGRLSARPVPTGGPGPPPVAETGLVPLGLRARRDGFVYVPERYRPDVPAPLSVKFHGAGGDGRAGIGPFVASADELGLLLLGTDARGATWDVIRGGYGDDVAFLDEALAAVFQAFAVDAGRLSIQGFSDGASYALSIGLTNGDLFRRIVAFSPGFMVPGVRHGQPEVFVSHGVDDRVLPIDRCSRRLVGQLRSEGYTVEYHEFDGGHTVPYDVAAEAEVWATRP